MASSDSCTSHAFGRHRASDSTSADSSVRQIVDIFDARWRAEHPDLQHGRIALELGDVTKLIDEELGRHSQSRHPERRNLSSVRRIERPTDGTVLFQHAQIRVAQREVRLEERTRRGVLLRNLRCCEHPRGAADDHRDGHPTAEGLMRTEHASTLPWRQLIRRVGAVLVFCKVLMSTSLADVVSSLAVLVGAELNAAIEKVRRSEATRHDPSTG
jgi:hypothetical protein